MSCFVLTNTGGSAHRHKTRGIPNENGCIRSLRDRQARGAGDKRQQSTAPPTTGNKTIDRHVQIQIFRQGNVEPDRQNFQGIFRNRCQNNLWLRAQWLRAHHCPDGRRKSMAVETRRTFVVSKLSSNPPLRVLFVSVYRVRQECSPGWRVLHALQSGESVSLASTGARREEAVWFGIPLSNFLRIYTLKSNRFPRALQRKFKRQIDAQRTRWMGPCR